MYRRRATGKSSHTRYSWATNHGAAAPIGSHSDAERKSYAGLPACSAAPGKFEAKRFCSEKRIITRCDVTYCCIFVVLYMKEPSHADPSAPLSRGRPPHVGYGVETDERGPGLPSRSSGP